MRLKVLFLGIAALIVLATVLIRGEILYIITGILYFSLLGVGLVLLGQEEV